MSDGSDEPAPWEEPVIEGEQDVSGQEVEVATVAAPRIQMTDPLQTMMDWCAEYVAAHAADDAAVMAQEVARILGADSMAQALEDSKPIAGKEYLEKPFLVHSFSLNETDYSEGWPFYASMRCTNHLESGEFVVNCGGPKVIAVLWRASVEGEWPYAFKIRGKETKAGYTVLQLVPAGA